MIQTQPRAAAEAARNQFLSSFRMLRMFTDVCPDAVWEARFFGFSYPVWYQVYHTAYFVDFWFQEEYAAEPVLCMSFDERIPPEFEHEPDPGLLIPMAEMRAYLALLEEKTGRFFDRITDGMLGQEIPGNESNRTYLDVVCCQIRHVMYNVGYLNAILRSLGLEESDWYAYNEPEN